MLGWGWGDLQQGSPTPRLWTGTDLWSVRNWAAEQEVSPRGASEALSVFTAAPHHLRYRLSSAYDQIIGGFRFLYEREPCYELCMREI